MGEIEERSKNKLVNAKRKKSSLFLTHPKEPIILWLKLRRCSAITLPMDPELVLPPSSKIDSDCLPACPRLDADNLEAALVLPLPRDRTSGFTVFLPWLFEGSSFRDERCFLLCMKKTNFNRTSQV